MASDLETLARRLEDDPFFLACPLKLYAQSEQLDDSGLASRLRCAKEVLLPVRLCRAPAPEDDCFYPDVQRISARFSLDAEVLAEAIRRGQAFFHMSRGGKPANTLLAARDGEAQKPVESEGEEHR